MFAPQIHAIPALAVFTPPCYAQIMMRAPRIPAWVQARVAPTRPLCVTTRVRVPRIHAQSPVDVSTLPSRAQAEMHAYQALATRKQAVSTLPLAASVQTLARHPHAPQSMGASTRRFPAMMAIFAQWIPAQGVPVSTLPLQAVRFAPLNVVPSQPMDAKPKGASKAETLLLPGWLHALLAEQSATTPRAFLLPIALLHSVVLPHPLCIASCKTFLPAFALPLHARPTHALPLDPLPHAIQCQWCAAMACFVQWIHASIQEVAHTCLSIVQLMPATPMAAMLPQALAILSPFPAMI